MPAIELLSLDATTAMIEERPTRHATSQGRRVGETEYLSLKGLPYFEVVASIPSPPLMHGTIFCKS
jgi:hypothetical protein